LPVARAYFKPFEMICSLSEICMRFISC
jgi:hypothetical protein